MFTQQAPAIINALSGVLPDSAVRALTQALGNCQQPLAHRGPVNLAPREPAMPRGVVNNNSWNPQQYTNLFPTDYSQYYFEAPGIGSYSNGNWYSTNYDGGTFSFPLNQEFNANEYYGGPTFNVGGNSFFNNTFANNAQFNTTTTQELTTQVINGFPIPASPPGGAVGGPVPPPGAVGQIINEGDTFFSGGGTSGDADVEFFLERVYLSGKNAATIRVPYQKNFRLADDCTIDYDEEVVELPVDVSGLKVQGVPKMLRYLRPRP